MGKKKIKLGAIIFIVSIAHMYSQELQWKEQNEMTKRLYESMQNFINEESHVKVTTPSISEVGLFAYFNNILTKRDTEKRLADEKQAKQQKAKLFLDTHFVSQDTISKLIFINKKQIQEWGESLAIFKSIQLEGFSVGKRNFLILMVDKCSGVRCLSIYVFEQKNENWELVTGSDTNIKENIIIKIDNEQEKIIFETTSRRIGELLFKT